MSCEADRFTKPIPGTSDQFAVDIADGAQSITDIIGGNLNLATRKVLLSFELDPSDLDAPKDPKLVGRFWEDLTAPTALKGHPIIKLTVLRLTLEQAIGFRHIALIDGFVNITEYGIET